MHALRVLLDFCAPRTPLRLPSGFNLDSFRAQLLLHARLFRAERTRCVGLTRLRAVPFVPIPLSHRLTHYTVRYWILLN